MKRIQMIDLYAVGLVIALAFAAYTDARLRLQDELERELLEQVEHTERKMES